MFRALRIVILTFVLINVALGAWLTRARTTAWEEPLRVVIFPINGDGLDSTSAYIRQLTREHFRPVEDFMRDEAQRYALTQNDPLDVFVADEVEALPPRVPPGAQPAARCVVEPAAALVGVAPRRLRRTGSGRAHVRAVPRSR